ncbi:hypothetical protein CEY12_05955 [Chryseobacterium sp. T16E-39]|uniref:HEPN domain-containing protein n=1 Tax=Chryseobacterium sp. T16E-39 TaxID=2015076 RepID=UPI000B5B2998|nr:HEPN domain-containing protein [Chryseobacterium sp. T16E-39]ASK29675.1 hypothetical protein CEY12_05955 [Chryseobacterium sp. T16E-39]
MEISHFCIVEIKGMELDKDTSIPFENYFITNKVKSLLEQTIPFFNPNEFLKIFGAGDFNKIADGNIFLLFSLFKNFNQNQAQNHVLGMLTHLWRIKDNSVHSGQFFFIPRGPEEVGYYRGTMPIIYNSTGSVNKTYFSNDDFKSLVTYIKELQSRTSTIKVDYSKDMEGGELGLWQKVIHYEDLGRLERGMSFITNARSESLLPLKITNYIAFLECLFSTSTDRISHTVSDRVSKFVSKYNSTDQNTSYRLVKDCYDVRSKYIHGTELVRNKTSAELKIISVKLDEVCRLVINNILTKNLTIFNDNNTNLDLYFSSLQGS